MKNIKGLNPHQLRCKYKTKSFDISAGKLSKYEKYKSVKSAPITV